MKFSGVLVRPLADQADRDGRRIDPAGVTFLPGVRYPVTVEFDMDNAVGTATVSRADDGSLVAEGDLDGDGEAIMGAKPPQLAVGIHVIEDERDRMGAELIRRSKLNAIALTANHADPGQPPIEEVPE